MTCYPYFTITLWPKKGFHVASTPQKPLISDRRDSGKIKGQIANVFMVTVQYVYVCNLTHRTCSNRQSNFGSLTPHGQVGANNRALASDGRNGSLKMV